MKINLIYKIENNLFTWRLFFIFNNNFRSNEFLLGLNTFLVLIFVVFVTDGPHFDKMFKMVVILTECLKWSSF